jgi:hypothetical protein
MRAFEALGVVHARHEGAGRHRANERGRTQVGPCASLRATRSSLAPGRRAAPRSGRARCGCASPPPSPPQSGCIPGSPSCAVDADELHCEPPLVLSCRAAGLPHG